MVLIISGIIILTLGIVALTSELFASYIVEINFESSLEGKILHFEQVRGKDYAYVHFINGPYQGRRGWVPIKPKQGAIRFYAVEKHQAFQVIEPENAKFVRVTKNVVGLLNLDFIAEDLNVWKYGQNKYTIDFFAQYPRTKLRKVAKVSDNHWRTSCPDRPIRKSGKACALPPKRGKLPAWIINDLKNSARRHDVHPAIVAAIIQKESFFNPFSENQYEKKLCKKQKRSGKNCAAYHWGQGFPQLGATNSKEFGLRWIPNLQKPKQCRPGRHIWRRSCYNYLVRTCALQKKKTGLADSYCPREGIDAVAKYVSSLINTEHYLRVDIVDENGKWMEKVINIKDHMRRVLAEEFRYIAGMYNRGKRPINSVEEYFRQNGKAPEWYDLAWTTRRVDGVTPSSGMGYMILYKESINRCHVWQIAGLCGPSLGDSLAGKYLEIFPNWLAQKSRVIASEKSQATPTSTTSP